MVHHQEAKKWPQHISGILASIPMLCTGNVISWTSPALDYLQQPHNGERGLTNAEASWVASMLPLGALIGAIPAGYMADKLGRKVALLILSFPFIIGWTMIILVGQNAPLLHTARFFCGLGAGATMVVVPLYNEEIAEKEIRGTLGCYADFMITAGFLWTYALGVFLSYFWLTIASLVPPIIFFISFIWMPESPVYLLSKVKEQEAIIALGYLRGMKYLDNYSLQPEIALMKDYFIEGSPDQAENDHTLKKLDYIKQCFFISKDTSTTAKAMRIVFGLVIAAQLTCVEGVTYYTVEIFNRGKSTIPPDICNAILGVVQFSVSVTAAFSMDKLGRRCWLFVSGSGMAISMALLTIHSILLDSQEYISIFGWIPCFSITVFISAYAAGLASLPWLLMAELVPTESKGWVGTMCVFLSWSVQLIVTQVFNIILNRISDNAAYSISGFFSIVAILYTALCIPETKNKSRAEIQNKLKEKKCWYETY